VNIKEGLSLAVKLGRLLILSECAVLGIGFLLASCGGSSSGPATSNATTYVTLNYPNSTANSSTFLTGIRGVENSSNVYISGIYASSGNVGLAYQGPLTGGGTWYTLKYPSSSGITVTNTALYGPDNNGSGSAILVGNYTTTQQGADTPIGLIYKGPLNGSGTWSTVMPPNAVVAIPHSTMNGLVVGNYDTAQVAVTGKAFIYDTSSGSYSYLVKPGALSITAYGIWYNGGTSYTIAGGYTDAAGAAGYLADWDSATLTASNWTSYSDPRSATLLTHFEGITTDGDGGYNLASDQLLAEGGAAVGAAFVNVPRTASRTFGRAVWEPISYPQSTLTSANTVYSNSILGIYHLGTSASNGYVATIPGAP
jgi:hypothetical protein